MHLLTWDHAGAPANGNREGPTGRLVLPGRDVDCMTLLLRDPEQPELNSEYLFLHSPRPARG